MELPKSLANYSCTAARKIDDDAKGRRRMFASLLVLREQAGACRACPLWKDATQTVFGEGPPSASIMLVGEQPGDKEDLAGKPFVGPAGQLLDSALKRMFPPFIVNS
jgi:uracil-DNA glycosylase